MKQNRLWGVIAFLLVGLLAAHAQAVDAQWTQNQRASPWRLLNLLQPVQLTEPLRLGDRPVGPCVVQVDASRVESCATDLSFADPFAVVSNTLTLKLDGTLHLVGGQLSVVSAPPSGAAGGVLSGTYPNPGFATAGAHSVLAVSGASTATPVFIGGATAGQVFMADPSTTALGWEIPPLVTLSTPGYMSAADKLKINGGVTPTVTTDLLRYGDLQTCVGVIQWTGSALGCAPTLGFLDPFAVVGGNLTLKYDTTTLGIPGGVLTVLTAPGASVRADGIATGSVQLASLAAASLADGTIAKVDSVGDFFQLQQSSLATTNTTVVTASGKAGYQWVRMNIENVTSQQVTVWYVDPLSVVHACNDENTGLASSAPLCTMAEVARRTKGATYPIAGTGCVVYLESSKSTSDLAVFQYNVTAPATSSLNPGGFDAPFMVIGVLTDLGFSGVVSSAQNGALGSTQDIHFTDSGIPTSFTASGFLATNVIFYKTSGTPGYFWPALDVGSKTLRTSQINTGFGTYTTFTNGDTYRVYSQPNFNATTFPAVDAEFPTAAIFGVTVSDASGKDPATTNPGIMWFEDSFQNLQQHAGWYVNDQFIGQQFFNAASYSNRFGGFVYSGLGRATGTTTQWLMKLGATWLMSDEVTGFTTMEDVVHLIDVSGDAEMIQAQYFDNTKAPITMGQGSFASVITIGGSGNSSIFNLRNTTSRITYANAPPAGMSTSGTPVQILGSSFAVSALPVADVTTGTFIVPQSATPALVAGMVKANASGYLGPATDGTDFLSPTTGVPVARRINTTAPMTGGGTLAGDLTLAVPVFAGSIAGLVPPSGGGTTAFLRADGSYAVPPGTGVAGLADPGANGIVVRTATNVTTAGQLSGPVTTSGTSLATSLNLAAGGVTGALPGGSFPALTGPVTTPGGSLATTVNLGAGGFTGSLPLSDVTISGLSPIVVNTSTGVVSCPTCGTSSGSVTGVFGSPGRIIVSPSTPNPTVDLAFAGLGAGAYGGSGIAGLNLDDYGRVLNLTTANYQLALSFPAAHYITDSTGSGLTGDVSFQRDPSTNAISMAGLAVNGATLFSNSSFVFGHSSNANRDRGQFDVGGGTLGPTGTGDSTLVDFIPTSTAVAGGVTGGVYSTLRIRPADYTGSGQTITEAASLYIDGAPNLHSVSGQTYALHVVGGKTGLGDVVLGGSITMPLYASSGTPLLGVDNAGLLTVNATSSVFAGRPAMDLVYYLELTAGNIVTISAGNQYVETSSPSALLSSGTIEYPTADFTPESAKISVYLTGANTLSTGSLSLQVMVNGTAGIHAFGVCNVTLTSASSGTVSQGCLYSGSPASTDTIGLLLSGSGVTATGTLRLAVRIRVSPELSF